MWNLNHISTFRIDTRYQRNTCYIIHNTFARGIYTKSTNEGSRLKDATKKSSSFSFFRSPRWKYTAKAIKYTRIPALILSVFSIGYTNGITDYMRNPRKWQESMLQSILADVGCNKEENQVFVAVQGRWKNDPRLKEAQYCVDATRTYISAKDEDNSQLGYGNPNVNTTNAVDGINNNSNQSLLSQQRNKKLIQLVNVAYVSEKILESAKQLVSQKLQDTAERNTSYLSYTKTLEEDEHAQNEIEKWTTAYDSLETNYEGFGRVFGQETQSKWKFVLLDVPMVNAFVSETTPHTIYVTTGLLDHVVSNDDELALVLGHELSHLLLAHSSKSMLLERNLKTIEVLLLTMDPTEGLLSLFVMTCINYIRNITSASNSRKHEKEADELGIQLAAMSCFDTRRAAKVFAKMYQFHVELEDQMMNKRITTISKIDEASNKTETSTKSNDARGGYELSSYLDSHPPSMLRYENLFELSKEENPNKYKSKCSDTRSKFLRALHLL